MLSVSNAIRHICHVSALLLAVLTPVYGQETATPAIAVPGFWGAEDRGQKPDLIGARVVRFLTDDEYPPLHFAGVDGNPTGFSVELARAACAVLEINCTVQVRRFDTLLDSLAEQRGDVVAAAIPMTEQLYRRFAVTSPYYRTPARFAHRQGAEQAAPFGPAAIAQRKVGIVADTAHEAYLRDFFPAAIRVTFADLDAAEAALKEGAIDYLFADGMSLALWINGAAAGNCCAFTGGAYLESRYFGEGVGFIVREDDTALRDALDYALKKLWENGTYTELYLRHFPVGFY